MRIKILTINIWNRSGPWEARRALLSEGVAALAPDLIGLQEVMSDGTHTLAHEVLAGLGYGVVYGEAKPLLGGISFGNAAASRWPIAPRGVEPLPALDTDERRSALFTEVSTPIGPLPFAVTHLAWKLHHGYLREAQARALGEAITTREPPADARLPLVLCGDFNARPDAAEMRYLTGLQSLDGSSMFLTDCFEAAGAGPGFTFDGRHNPHAAMAFEVQRRIDYVLVRGPDERGRGVPLTASVVLTEVRDGVAASDHFGVLTELDFTLRG